MVVVEVEEDDAELGVLFLLYGLAERGVHWFAYVCRAPCGVVGLVVAGVPRDGVVRDVPERGVFVLVCFAEV